MDHLLDHLNEEAEQAGEDSLQRIRRLAEDYKDRETIVKRLEAELKEAKKAFNKVSMELIPQAMMEVNIQSFQLDTGENVSFKEEVKASVKDYDRFYNFLEDRGDAALMKISLIIGKVPQSILAKIVQELHNNFGILAETKMFIHPMTLNKYIRELCGLGAAEDAEMTLAELDDAMIAAYTYYKTKVK